MLHISEGKRLENGMKKNCWGKTLKSVEKGMATHCSILAWRIPWTEEPGGATVHVIATKLLRLFKVISLLVTWY